MVHSPRRNRTPGSSDPLAALPPSASPTSPRTLPPPHDYAPPPSIPRQRPAVVWVLIIALGVFAGNIATTAMEWTVAYLVTVEVLQSWQTSLERFTAQDAPDPAGSLSPRPLIPTNLAADPAVPSVSSVEDALEARRRQQAAQERRDQEITQISQERRAAERRAQAVAEAEITNRRTREAQRQREAQAQLQATCNFWRNEASRDDSERNRTLRDAACARLQQGL